MTQKFLLLFLLGTLLIVGDGFWILRTVSLPVVPSRACPEDAKLCPDGSSVSHIGPKCEFAECPGNNTRTSVQDFEKNTEKTAIDTSNWKTYRNEKYGFEVKYPSNPAWQIEESSPEIKAYRHIHIYPINPPPTRIDLGSEFVAITIQSNTTLAQERERIRSQNLDNIKEAERIYIGDEAAYHYFHTETPERTHFFFLEHAGRFLTISTTNYDMPEVKQILSTFKFTK